MHRLLIALFALIGCQTGSAQVNACGGDGNWPPMSYQVPAGSQVDGISAEVLRAIFPDIKIQLRPWPRCLLEVQTAQHMDIAMSALKNSDREKNYLFSRSYHALTPSYLYEVKRYPQPPVTRLADLSRLKVCALHGSMTSYSNLTAAQIDSSASNYDSLLKKIDRARCDLVIDMREVFFGFAKLGLLPFDSQQYRIVDLPETRQYHLHYAVSKTHPHAAMLVEKIDQGIAELQKNGRLAAIIRQYQFEKTP